ncbi:Rpn14p [Ascoidea rubescens DSM 1968]|uniref:WD40 repeat-like protein n=1 Tax=Ascoidea rubescens DSM 1968 TaxID=1344418 RepID=A0A1D2VPS2_9ASCO|nr:WD40 repeat-like protein [Ascoidea rubescens DSM 1968]ODV63623.1 WD40 repeat-like protein [Ascoidea rubescens DSM 1968]
MEKEICLVTVQSSFKEVIDDVKSNRLEKDTFWIAFQPINETELNSKEYFINVSKHDNKLIFASNNRFGDVEKASIEFRIMNENSYEVLFKNHRYLLKTPNKTIDLNKLVNGSNGTDINKNINVASIDLSSDLKFYSIGDSKGNIYILNYSKDNQMVHFFKNYHDLDVSKLIIFPSNKVLMSNSLDYKTKITNLETGEIVREFLTNTQKVNDIKTIGQIGRNFLTISNDSNVKIFDIGSKTLVKSFYRVSNRTSIGSMVLYNDLNYEKRLQIDKNYKNYEFETKGKFIITGDSNGSLTSWNLFDEYQFFSILNSDDSTFSITALALNKDEIDSNEKNSTSTKDFYLAVGYDNGIIKIFKYNNVLLNKFEEIKKIKINFGNPITSLYFNENSIKGINDLIILSNNQILMSVEFSKLIEQNKLDITYFCGYSDIAQVNQINLKKNIVNSDSNLLIGCKYGTVSLFSY